MCLHCLALLFLCIVFRCVCLGFVFVMCCIFGNGLVLHIGVLFCSIIWLDVGCLVWYVLFYVIGYSKCLCVYVLFWSYCGVLALCMQVLCGVVCLAVCYMCIYCDVSVLCMV